MHQVQSFNNRVYNAKIGTRQTAAQVLDNVGAPLKCKSRVRRRIAFAGRRIVFAGRRIRGNFRYRLRRFLPFARFQLVSRPQRRIASIGRSILYAGRRIVSTCRRVRQNFSWHLRILFVNFRNCTF